MSDQAYSNDPRRIWKEQPEEQMPVNLKQIINRRTEELSSRTRSEILMSFAAALLLVGMVAWRLKIVHEGVLELAFGAAIAWIAVSLYFFRHRIWRTRPSRRDEIAATGLEFYRAELQRRRDHLRNEWIWHGPLFIALTIFLAVLTGRSNIAFRPLQNVLPVLVLLAAWTGFGIWRRRLQARDLQREIDDIASPGTGER
jgi:hypothetical protein